MRIITTIKEMKAISREAIHTGKSIGFVPTMGYLHDGHLTLANKAKQENDIVIMSIFVNPLQFGPNEDFASYPRDRKRDEQLAESVGVDYVFYPTVEEMYPRSMEIEIKVKSRVNVLCGRNRIGHFDGVATVLIKLFSIVQPTNAYFGLKDAQQVAVVDGLIADLNLPVQLNAVETVREEDGLAKSSRNVYLTEVERGQAKELYQSLLYGKKLIEQGERNPDAVISKMKDYLIERINGSIEYIELYSYPELATINECHGKIIIALAVKFSQARLIDNIILYV
ncbi:pantoate--beta-alanine ligase [Caldibacillus lycopersici]|uniref:Pantothenate synthetase n=1 Tax=Perspicuibacillus lycopersici TaxID=1325689 RepID=A0AAE3IUK0_9BACI|nr:pantoate--beta-alanine ligase [Perspicuibacillus lycopersici]MCU9613686.1 pantoate--beta-alanine ligase [Perspicuibacillus lycopersici]